MHKAVDKEIIPFSINRRSESAEKYFDWVKNTQRK